MDVVGPMALDQIPFYLRFHGPYKCQFISIEDFTRCFRTPKRGEAYPISGGSAWYPKPAGLERIKKEVAVDKWKLERLVVYVLSVANSDSSSRLATALLQSETDQWCRVGGCIEENKHRKIPTYLDVCSLDLMK